MTLEQMAASFTTSAGLTLKSAPHWMMHDAVHYITGLSASDEDEYLVINIYQPIIWGGSEDDVLDKVGDSYLHHVYRATVLRKQHGHLFS